MRGRIMVLLWVVVFWSLHVSHGLAGTIEIRRIPATLSVITVDGSARVSPNEAEVAARGEIVEAELSRRMSPNSNPASLVTSLPLIKDVPMQALDEGTLEIVRDIASYGNKLWGVESDFTDSKYIVSINKNSGAVKKISNCPGTYSNGNWGLAASKNRLWAVNSLDDVIYELSQATGAVIKSHILVGTESIIQGGTVDNKGYVWFTQWDYSGSRGGAKIFKLNPKTSSISTAFQLEGVKIIEDLAFDSHSNLYASVNTTDDTYLFLKINPVGGKILAEYDKDPCVYGLAFSGGTLIAADWFNKEYHFYRTR